MARSNVRVPLGKPPTDGDGNGINNKILLSLPRKECSQILAELELVRLKLHQVIHEAGETIKSGYFVNTGMLSVLAIQPDGKSVEVGLIGNEGFLGVPLLVGYRTSPTRVVNQGDGTAYRCDAQALRRVVRQCPGLEQQLHHFGYQLAMQTTQIAACNRLHDVEERLARWILMTQDRLGTDHLPLTQEFLGQMLGTRRSIPARRLSGRSAAERLDPAPALRTLSSEKRGVAICAATVQCARYSIESTGLISA
jgi:CRP-like cAMP-binding protein